MKPSDETLYAAVQTLAARHEHVISFAGYQHLDVRSSGLTAALWQVYMDGLASPGRDALATMLGVDLANASFWTDLADVINLLRLRSLGFDKTQPIL